MTWDPEEDVGTFPVVYSLANRLGVMCTTLNWLSEHIDMRSVGQLGLAQSRARSRAAFSSSQDVLKMS